MKGWSQKKLHGVNYYIHFVFVYTIMRTILRCKGSIKGKSTNRLRIIWKQGKPLKTSINNILNTHSTKTRSARNPLPIPKEVNCKLLIPQESWSQVSPWKIYTTLALEEYDSDHKAALQRCVEYLAAPNEIVVTSMEEQLTGTYWVPKNLQVTVEYRGNVTV